MLAAAASSTRGVYRTCLCLPARRAANSGGDDDDEASSLRSSPAQWQQLCSCDVFKLDDDEYAMAAAQAQRDVHLKRRVRGWHGDGHDIEKCSANTASAGADEAAGWSDNSCVMCEQSCDDAAVYRDEGAARWIAHLLVGLSAHGGEEQRELRAQQRS